MRISEDEFTALVARALDNLPPEFAAALDNIAVVVEDQASAIDLAEVGLDHPDDLLGLYRGVPLTERQTEFVGGLPDQVVIYRLPIVRICETRREVVREVRDTVVHELGHHFGLSDDDMPF
ncbi:MAG: metallopeptidase family protein [Acidobacteriota bacterium]